MTLVKTKPGMPEFWISGLGQVAKMKPKSKHPSPDFASKIPDDVYGDDYHGRELHPKDAEYRGQLGQHAYEVIHPECMSRITHHLLPFTQSKTEMISYLKWVIKVKSGEYVH
jgi:hypothetical protein